MSKSVIVGIPIYKEIISELEKISLCQADIILSNYTKVFIAPQSLTFDYGHDYSVIRFPDKFFFSTESYTELLLSQEFYQKFESYEYLLIYQLDAFVFHDSLREICSLGYDYVGAPLKGTDWQLFHVGNGGLSLRNVKKCGEITRRKQYIIEKIHKVMTPEVLAEDVFFGYCGWDKEIDFSVPPPRMAARFSVQTDYVKGMRTIEKQGLPFGCHYWWRSNYEFWKPYIEEYGYDLPTLETSNSLKSDAIRRMMYLVKRYTRKDIVFTNNSIDYAVYGGGIWGNKCVNFLKQLSLNVIRVYAQESDKSSICGVPVVKPSKKEIIRNEMFIVIGTLKYENEIKAMLIEMGLKEGEGFCTLYDFCCRAAKGCSGGIAKIINCASMK